MKRTLRKIQRHLSAYHKNPFLHNRKRFEKTLAILFSEYIEVNPLEYE